MELELREVTKKFGDKVALDRFSFTFRTGIYGILGANGAGKSTMMNLITDNLRRDGGSITYDGVEIKKLGADFRRVLGYMTQQQGLYEGMTAESFLVYMARLKEIPRKAVPGEIRRVLEMSNLADVSHKKVGEFSGGMKQRVLLAQALLGDPRVMILDEPTAGLDPKERARLRDHIYRRAQDRIVLLATHIVSDIEAIADCILLMKEGRLLRAGTAAQLIASLPADWKPVLHAPSLEDVYLYYLGDDSHE
ncbi:MAG TPA: ATP-binding cassette domain-containing protein [Candidatus Faecousia excrementigallinarum]|uniref:ATP-binding cassette domain-containing protein n=1 Tax=Candidatus Faecousia excrementigallinarum TaxID=2840806 RepID=A0A9D0Z1Q5_9FIRM|nr:ATP-binding cassette domain-containing protein [Candidatus Faecousia excrementigallinarum]